MDYRACLECRGKVVHPEMPVKKDLPDQLDLLENQAQLVYQDYPVSPGIAGTSDNQ